MGRGIQAHCNPILLIIGIVNRGKQAEMVKRVNVEPARTEAPYRVV